MSVVTQSSALPTFSAGTLTALKLLGLALMTVDHWEAFFTGRAVDTQLGRLVLPIFGWIVGYHLARMDSAGRWRMLRNLLAFGFLALPFHAALAAQAFGWWPLNIMFTFSAAVLIVGALESKQWSLAFVLFAGAGAVVEYNWPGLAFCLSVWFAYRNASPLSCFLPVLALGLLYLPNGSHAALYALPILFAAGGANVALPRWKWLFYAYYPAHLAVMWYLIP